MIALRKLHRVLGLTIAPLVLLQAVGGVLLRLKVTSPFLYSIHTWYKYNPGLVPAIGVVTIAVAVLLGLSLTVQAVSGAVMYINMRVMQAKRKAAQRKQAEGSSSEVAGGR
jgi:uncharacterized iron-regulated membrane protein